MLKGRAQGSCITVGNTVSEHVDLTSTDKRAKVSIGGLHDKIEVVDSEQSEPTISLDNKVTGQTKSVVFNADTH